MCLGILHPSLSQITSPHDAARQPRKDILEIFVAMQGGKYNFPKYKGLAYVIYFHRSNCYSLKTVSSSHFSSKVKQNGN